jgi:hypothetical protein
MRRREISYESIDQVLEHGVDLAEIASIALTWRQATLEGKFDKAAELLTSLCLAIDSHRAKWGQGEE